MRCKPGEVGQARRFEQRTQLQLHAQALTYPGDHLDGQQGMPTQFKEVVAQAHPLQLQHIGPDRRDLLFQFALRGDVCRLQQTGIRLRQCTAVQLAVGGQRQPGQEQQVGRHHVVRQARLQRSAQRIPLGSLGLGAGHHSRIGRHHITHQLLAARAVLGQHHALGHAGLRLQPRLDLAQFDAKTSNLHLMVDPPQVLHHPAPP